MHRVVPRRRVARLAPLLAVAAVLAAGCSSSTKTAARGGGSTSAGSSGSSALIAQAQAVVDKAEKRASIPALTPVKVVPGKTIGVLVCGNVAPSCVTMGQAEKQAIESVGYKAILCDGQVNPRVWATCDQTFINDHVDAIINSVASDAVVASAVRAARTAGIPVICQVCYNSGSPVADAAKNGSNANTDADWHGEGVTLGNWMIVQAKGKPRAGLIDNSIAPNVAARMKGIKDTLTQCKSLGCTYTLRELPAGQTDDGVSAARKITAGFLQTDPKLTTVVPPDDSQAVGIQQSLATSSGTTATIAGWGCGVPSLGWIRDGGKYQAADIATPLVWTSWAAVDQAIRIIAGQPGRDVILPSQLITGSNIPSGTCEKSSDYAATYEAAWIK